VENILKIKGLEADAGDDILRLEELARSIIDTVELKVEEGVPRLIMNLSEDEYSVVFSHASDEEVNQMLLGEESEISYTEGIRMHMKEIRLSEQQQQQQSQFHQNRQQHPSSGHPQSPNHSGSALASSPGKSPQKFNHDHRRSSFITATSEALFAIVKAATTSDPDKAELSFYFPFGSRLVFRSNNGQAKRGTPVLPPNKTQKIIIGLPSIMQADSELVLEFFQNIVKQYVIEWNSDTNNVELVVVSPEIDVSK